MLVSPLLDTLPCLAPLSGVLFLGVTIPDPCCLGVIFSEASGVPGSVSDLSFSVKEWSFDVSSGSRCEWLLRGSRDPDPVLDLMFLEGMSGSLKILSAGFLIHCDELIFLSAGAN